MSGTVRMIGIAALVVVGLIVLISSTYTLDEAKQAVILQFGKSVGTVKEPGLHWKVPFVQEVRRFEKRLVAWDGEPDQVPTKEQESIAIDTTARWRIADPLKFLQSVRSERQAQSRLDGIITDAIRSTIRGSDLVEIVRSKDWEPKEELKGTYAEAVEQEEIKKEVTKGRETLTQNMLEEARKQAKEYGIRVVDIRIKRLNYVEKVRKSVFGRMEAAWEKRAEEYRAVGTRKGEEMKAKAKRKAAEITAKAERKAEEIRGEADAEAAAIYNQAFGTDPEFYRFYRTLDSYEQTINNQTTLILGADSAYFRFLQELPQQSDGQKPKPAEEVASP